MGKGLHKLFKAVVNKLLESLPIMGESGSEVSYFVPEPVNFVEVIRLSEDIGKPWIKATMKQIKSSINNNIFLVDDPQKGDAETPCIDVHKVTIQYDASLDKFKLIIVVREDLQNKYLIRDKLSSTASMRTFKCFLEDSVKQKSRVHELYFIGAL